MQFHMRRIFGVLSVLVVLTMVLSACTDRGALQPKPHGAGCRRR